MFYIFQRRVDGKYSPPVGQWISFRLKVRTHLLLWPDSLFTWQMWHKSRPNKNMTIAQVHVMPDTIKGAAIMCTFICQLVNVNTCNDTRLRWCEIVGSCSHPQWFSAMSAECECMTVARGAMISSSSICVLWGWLIIDVSIETKITWISELTEFLLPWMAQSHVIINLTFIQCKHLYPECNSSHYIGCKARYESRLSVSDMFELCCLCRRQLGCSARFCPNTFKMVYERGTNTKILNNSSGEKPAAGPHHAHWDSAIRSIDLIKRHVSLWPFVGHTCWGQSILAKGKFSPA